jgi:hypothetical protein
MRRSRSHEVPVRLQRRDRRSLLDSRRHVPVDSVGRRVAPLHLHSGQVVLWTAPLSAAGMRH